MAHSTTEPPPTESAVIKEQLRRFKLSMYILILVISILANTFMLLVLWRKFRRHRKTAKSFIVLMQNLALSSLVLVIVSIPFDAVWQESDTWPFGPVGCKILWPLQTASLQAVVYTYVALAYHRFYGVSKNLLGQMKFIYAVVTTFFIWIASIITVIPYVLNLDYNYVNDTCDKNWNSQSSRQGYTISLFLLDYLLPLIALLILYVMVWGKLQSYKILDPERASRRDRHSRVMRMMVSYVIVFALFLLPHQIMSLIQDFGNGDKKLHFKDAKYVLNIFTYSVTIANPVLFFVYNPEFRRHFWHFFKCHCITKKERFSIENLSESFSEESIGPRRPQFQPPPKYEVREMKENNYVSTPTMQRSETSSLPRHDSALGLVEAGLFPSAVDRMRTAGKYRESTPSASPPGSDVVSYTDGRDVLDQGSEML